MFGLVLAIHSLVRRDGAIGRARIACLRGQDLMAAPTQAGMDRKR